ncbi:hypothetical protein KGR20_21825 [Cytobacillus oceanisediminis]|uniref:Uncharacterized protein n=1 Tax=Niallia alba TaxID=2729105 RepID=A0A7Y0K5A5_9BACI|nr:MULTISPECIES: hypothetical protein [Bacillaceae]MBZ9536802.1 hypothetical protein [Cytobacillus oceanisediminis]NMO75718.1 hypothetical protein [Niallia alba]UTI43515.1 hypothetical protein NKG37_07525 [Niallia sp. RD1]
MEKTNNKNKVEKLLWSIALPGFGQILNGKYLKGVLLIALEILVNVQANFNLAIIYSFHGEIKQAIEVTNYQWLMFYPCLYMFAIWDAYKDSGGGKSPFSFIPIVFAAYFITVGLIYSSTFKIFGVLMGPIWLPIIFLGIGLCVGLVIRGFLINIFE